MKTQTLNFHRGPKFEDALTLKLCLHHPELRKPLFAGYQDLRDGKARVRALKAKLKAELFINGFVPPPINLTSESK